MANAGGDAVCAAGDGAAHANAVSMSTPQMSAWTTRCFTTLSLHHATARPRGSVGPPLPSLPHQQVIGFLGAHGAGRIVWKINRRMAGPVYQQRVNNRPLQLHLVAARE